MQNKKERFISKEKNKFGEMGYDDSPLSSVVAMMAITEEKCTRIFKKGEMEELITKANGGVLLTERYGEFIFIVAADKGIDLASIKPQQEEVV